MLRQIIFFQSISGSKTMLWNFQSVQCLEKHVEQDDGRKSWGWEAEFQERIRKELACACSVEGGFVGLDWTACPNLKVAVHTWKIQS